MEDYKLGVIESRFAEIVWNNAPMTTKQLVDLCAKELNWKRTTTYSVLKKLCDKGMFKMEDKIVTVLVTKQEYDGLQSEKFVDEAFNGSLPSFLVAFGSRNKLSSEEVDELKRVIEGMRR